MTEQYIFWALVVGIAIGAALYWFALGRLPRRTDDQTLAERKAEADWISRTVESRGGVAPTDLVEEVLELHASYLEGPPLDVDEPLTSPAEAVLAPPTNQPVGEPRGN